MSAISLGGCGAGRSASFLLVSSIVWATVNHTLLADWPQFRGPSGLGVSHEQSLPVSWSDDKNIAWKIELPGWGASSPTILGDDIFLTCYSGYGTGEAGQKIEALTLHVICVDRRTGRLNWDKRVPPKLPESERVRDHGYAGPTPATDGEALYVFFGKTGVLKFDLAGNKLWQADVGDGTHGWGCGTSPVLTEHLVIVNASVESGALVALDKATGERVWTADGMRRSWNTPHLVDLEDGRQELVVSVQGLILAFDPATGTKIWQCDGIQDYVCPSVISHEGVVYAIGGRKSRAIAVRAGGKGDVTDTHRLWEAKAGANVSSPVIHDGHMYWVSDRNRVAYCLRLSDGEILYSQRFKGQPYASTVLGGDKLYVVTRYDGTFVLQATPEYTELAHNVLENDSTTFNASPAISDGQLFIRSDQYLYCIGNTAE